VVIIGWVSRLDGAREGGRGEFWLGSRGRGGRVILKWVLRSQVVKL
jgi:hypothetical protein